MAILWRKWQFFGNFFWKKWQVFDHFLTFKWQFSGGSADNTSPAFHRMSWERSQKSPSTPETNHKSTSRSSRAAWYQQTTSGWKNTWTPYTKPFTRYCNAAINIICCDSWNDWLSCCSFWSCVEIAILTIVYRYTNTHEVWMCGFVCVGDIVDSESIICDVTGSNCMSAIQLVFRESDACYDLC